MDTVYASFSKPNQAINFKFPTTIENALTVLGHTQLNTSAIASANIASADITTAAVSQANISAANISTANITVASLVDCNITNANVASLVAGTSTTTGDLTINGNLGVGTSNAQQKLHVVGNGRVDGALYVNGDRGVVADFNDSQFNGLQVGFDTNGYNSYVKLPGDGTTLFFRDWFDDSILALTRNIVSVNATNFNVAGTSNLNDVNAGQMTVDGTLTVNGQLQLPTSSTLFARTLNWTNGGCTFGVPAGAIYGKKLRNLGQVFPDSFINFSGTPPWTQFDQLLTNSSPASMLDLGQVGTVSGDIRFGSGRFAEAFYSNADAPEDTVFCFRWHDNIGTPSTSDHGFLLIKCTVDNYGALFLNGARLMGATDGGSNPWRTIIVPACYHMSWEFICSNFNDGGSGLRMYYKVIGC